MNALLKDINEEKIHKDTKIKKDLEKNTDSQFKLPQPLNTKTLKVNLYKSQNSEMKIETKAPSVSTNLYNIKNKDKSNFAKFLERNTPIKISRTVSFN